MNCTLCKTGQTHFGLTTLTLQRNDSIVVIRGVPAEICQDCGEYYLDAHTAEKVYADAQDTAQRCVEVEIKRYAA